MQTKSARAAIATVDDFINQVATVKRADAPMSEAGSIGGETTHPVKKVDDRLKPAKEGERSAENTADVKEDQGPLSVDSTAKAKTAAAPRTAFDLFGRFTKNAQGSVSTPGSAADDHTSTTTTVAPTGEDPAHETNSAKAGKEDKKQGGRGGTTHPASTENDQLDGHKFASDRDLSENSAAFTKLANDLLVKIHNVFQSGTPAGSPSREKTAGVISPETAYQAGSELAGLANGTFDKRAADEMVRTALVETIKEASDDADRFVAYARGFMKSAEGEMPEEMPADPGAGGGGGEMPMPGGEEGAMMGALGGAEGGGMGGMGGGGMGGAGGGGGGGGVDEEQLAQILETLGVSEEELLAALEQGGGGGGAPPPMPGGGGAPPPMPGGGMEVQAGDRGLSKTAMSEHIREIISRSRKKN
jgi:hypothetical protein